jgi:Zinc carboxypeptidase
MKLYLLLQVGKLPIVAAGILVALQQALRIDSDIPSTTRTVAGIVWLSGKGPSSSTIRSLPMKRPFLFTVLIFLLSFLTLSQAAAQDTRTPTAAVTAPQAHFGFNMGDGYCLANYKQLVSYWAKLERESDRLKVVKIGETAEGRPQLMGIVTSPANHKNLAHYQDIARRLARAEGVSEAEATKLSAEGKAVVWIDGGLHASEVLCAQMLIETLYQFLTATDSETSRILDDVIILFVHANPDGMDLCADWYMRNKDPKKRSSVGLPRLYQKYIGHDNNRDFYANTQAETKNMNRVMYREWYPQIVFNHHQSGPAGTVLFCPPFRDPFNYYIDPLVISGIDALGANMMQRFLAEGKPGATCRSGARYSTWFNGGLRTASYFHNMIGLLTETIGSPAPMTIPLQVSQQLPKADYLAPIAPQTWHFRQSVDYSVTANKSVLDYASRHREQLLHNIWLMGKNAIERGNRDSWTITPKIVEAARGQGRGNAADYQRLFQDPARRDPRGFIISANQPDFLTATKFVNILVGTGVQVQRAKADFEVAGKKYPAGSLVVKSAQAFRAHVLDMFEPQDHPNDFAYPGAPPTAPYDAAGYTLAFQMAVQFDRILEGFTGPFEELKDQVPPPAARVAGAEGAAGFFLDTRMNDSYRAVNRLLKAGEEVRRLQEPFMLRDAIYPPGTFYIKHKPSTLPLLEKIAADLGTPFTASATAPAKRAASLKPIRIGLWDRYGGSMPSGWTRWLLEQFEFPFQLVYAPDLDKGNLRDKFDVLIFVDGAIPGGAAETAPEGSDCGLVEAATEIVDDSNKIPTPQRGSVTVATTVPQLRKFLESGGTILTIGSSTNLASHLKLPLTNHLVTKDAQGKEQALGRDKFYVPASVLHMRVNPVHSLAWGIGSEADVMFSASPTFRLSDLAAKNGLERVAWFDSKTPLRSGWAWGQDNLMGGVAIVEARVGQGKLVLFGPQILYRGQSHGTFKFFFNGIVQAGVQE